MAPCATPSCRAASWWRAAANVSNSIIMFSCVIKRGARVENAILDKNNVVPENTEYRGTPDAILVMGKGDHR